MTAGTQNKRVLLLGHYSMAHQVPQESMVMYTMIMFDSFVFIQSAHLNWDTLGIVRGSAPSNDDTFHSFVLLKFICVVFLKNLLVRGNTHIH